MWIVIVTVAVVLAGVGVFVYLRGKKRGEDDTAPLSPLPLGAREQVSVFQGFGGAVVEGEEADVTLARHNLYINVTEGWRQFWSGRAELWTHFSLVGTLDEAYVFKGLVLRERYLHLNPDIKTIVQIPCHGAADEYTDLPTDHAWWLRDAAGNRVPAWPGESGSYKLDLGNPALCQHIAGLARAAMGTGIWDGVFFDSWYDDANHVDLLRRVRTAIGAKLIICNCNYKICPMTVPLMDGAWIESGPIQTASEWALVQKALDFNERHVRQPARNLLEISGARNNLAKMRATTCLGLTRSNADVCYSDPNYLPTLDHEHDWHPFWDVDIGKPVGQPTAAGAIGSRREFEHGTAAFNPVGGNQIQLTFSEPRTDAATGERKTVHLLMPGDGGIYLV